eukprot:9481195-Pyramimonas_sp.AAC.2
MVLDYGGFNKSLGSVFVHYCGFNGGNFTTFCTCGHTDGIVIADNYVPWGETVCLVPPDVRQWIMPSDDPRCNIVRAPPRTLARRDVYQPD